MQLMKKAKEKVTTGVEMGRLLVRMNEIEDQTSDEYQDYLNTYKTLANVANAERDSKANASSKNEVIKGGVKLLVEGGLLLVIIGYETKHIFSGKGFNFWSSKSKL